MQSVLIMQGFLCKVSLLCRALYAKCPYYAGLSMQSVLIRAFNAKLARPARTVQAAVPDVLSLPAGPRVTVAARAHARAAPEPVPLPHCAHVAWNMNVATGTRMF